MESRPLIIFPVLLSVKVMLDMDYLQDFHVNRKLTSIFNHGALIGEERWNSSVFSLKSVINLLLWKIGGIQRIFLHVKKLLYVLEPMLASDNFLSFFEKCSLSEVSIILLNLFWNELNPNESKYKLNNIHIN